MQFLKDKTGFSLIELVVALVILSIIIPLSAFFINSMKTNDLTEEQQSANHVAQKYMEEYKAKRLEELQSLAGSSGFVKDLNTDYYVNVTVELVAVPKLETVTGDIKITKASGAPQITLGGTSYVANSGDTLILVVENSRLKLKSGAETKISKSFTSSSSKLFLNIIVENNPELTLKVQNKLSDKDKMVVFNTTDKENRNKKFKMEPDEGKVLIVINTEQPEEAKEYERGADITVIVKDKDNNKELIKLTQTKKI